MFRADLVNLNMIAIQFGRKAPCLEFLRLSIEFGDTALELHSEPQILLFIKAQCEAAGRRARLEQRQFVLGDLSCFWIELSQDLFAEARVPRQALGVDD